MSKLNALTSRQRQVLSLLATGLSNREIASQLQISEYTVINHLRVIYRTLGVTSRLAAITFHRQCQPNAQHHKGRRAYDLLSLIMTDDAR